jgi:hypothetical protein
MVMKQIFTNENRILAMHSKNILQNAGIEVTLKNEHGSIGVALGHQVWLEIWVSEEDYDRSLELLKFSEEDAKKIWVCESCNEENTAAFHSCWNCQTSPTNA